MSCNGCRVLRKGCSDNCILRPCLQWIEGAEAQGHATVFVAKFFGRAGLMNFISAIPENQRPALFQSLLFEACGRAVNPVFGAVGLLWSGNWHLCQAAVEAVLKGAPLQPLNSSSPASQQPPSISFQCRSPDSVLMEAIRSQQADHLVLDRQRSAPERIIQDQHEHPTTNPTKRELLVAPVPRRIRPRLQYDFGDHEAVNLDLSLGFQSPTKDQKRFSHQQQQQNERAHSPSESVTSEGSVTSVDTADLKISLTAA